MSMSIEGTVVDIFNIESGQGRNGEWRKLPFLMETFGTYGKKVQIEIWGDKIDQAELFIGKQIVAHIEVESREYNSRWYTTVKAWKIEKYVPLSDRPSGSSTVPPRQSAAQSTPPVNVGTNAGKGIIPEDSDSDLPF